MLEIENRVLSGRLEDLATELADLREEMKYLVSSEDKLLQMANLQPRASIVVHPIPESPPTPGIHRARLDMDHLLQEARRLKGSFYEIGDVLENDIDNPKPYPIDISGTSPRLVDLIPIRPPPGSLHRRPPYAPRGRHLQQNRDTCDCHSGRKSLSASKRR